MYRNIFYTIISLIILTACEEVIPVDLNSAEPAFVVEATIVKDSVCKVRLTNTTSYFSSEKPGIVEDATIKISTGTLSESLSYIGNGYYFGDSIIGTEETTYEIEIIHDGIRYEGISTMPEKSEIIAIRYGLDATQSVFNPNGRKMLTLTCVFEDTPDIENFYMIRFTSDSTILESYFMVDEENLVDGVIIDEENNTITYSESMFFESDNKEVEVKVFSIDAPVFKYFNQLNDALFWKRRIMPPSPHNPESNISNGALGYFAAWGVDSEVVVVE